MEHPFYILSMDPGGSAKTWAYCVSHVAGDTFSVKETGFVPVVDEIARPDFSSLLAFKTTIMERYPEGRMDLVAERFMSRGFVSWLMEHVGFHLGWWSCGWSRGACRLIMPAQWKKALKKKAPFTPKRYEEWWEEYWSALLTTEEFKKKTTHIQDAVGIAFWYVTKELKLNVTLPEITDGNQRAPIAS